MLRLKKIRYGSIGARGSFKTLAFLNIECKTNLEKKFVTTSPGLPYSSIFVLITEILWINERKKMKELFGKIRVDEDAFSVLSSTTWWVARRDMSGKCDWQFYCILSNFSFVFVTVKLRKKLWPIFLHLDRKIMPFLR